MTASAAGTESGTEACPRCQTDNEPQAKFCRSCGTALTTAG
ncbi:MAG: hypothetical protein DLM70_02100 [Chloroflexi bacterium]|nr:MAG: hypothetical protein DLM70_02100 [Chloroflexota bacterium]